jgi:hypothetical protein
MMRIDKKKLHFENNKVIITDILEKDIIFELYWINNTKKITRCINKKLFGIKLYITYFEE